MRERIGYYDVARGLGIIFVVIGHIDSFYTPVRSVVITFHMALFFMISGMLFLETGEEEKGFWEILRKKFCRIMVPYFCFSLLSIGIEFVRLWLQDVLFWPHFKSLFLSTLTLQGISVMWFLPALFFSELLFFVIRKWAGDMVAGKRAGDIAVGKRTGDIAVGKLSGDIAVGKLTGDIVVGKLTGDIAVGKLTGETAAGRLAGDIVTVVSVIFLAVITVWCNTLDLGWNDQMQDIFQMVIRSVYCTAFVCIGYLVRKYIIPLKIPGVAYGSLSVLLLGICAVMNHINPNVDLRAMYWGEFIFPTMSTTALVAVPAIMYLIGAVAGALGIIFLCKASDKFSKHLLLRILSFFGCNSLIIMATHLDFHVLHYCMDLAAFLNGFVPGQVFYQICILVFVFAAEAMLIQLINRFFPILAGKYKI